MKIKKTIKPHEMLPAFYGIAYFHYARNEVVCYPLVLNLVVILWREFLFWLQNPQGPRAKTENRETL